MNTVILTDSTSDIEKSVLDQLKVKVVALKVNFGEESFLDGIDLSKKEFFNNKMLWLAFFAGFVLLNLVLLVPFLQPVFSVTGIRRREQMKLLFLRHPKSIPIHC